MKKLFFLLTLIFFNQVNGQNKPVAEETAINEASTPGASTPGIIFIQKDWDLAKQQATKEGKTIFIDMYTTWCKPCKQMDKFVFSTEEVGQRFNNTFINVKIDAESEVGKQLAGEFGVLSYPTYVFASNEGDIIYKVKGAMTPQQLILEATKARSIARNFKPLRILEIDYENGERNHKFLYEYLRQKSNKQGRQPQLLEEYLAAVPKSELQTEKVLSVISKNIKSVESKAFDILKNALKNFDSLTDLQRKSILGGLTLAKKLTFKDVIRTNDENLLDKLIDAVYATAYSNAGAVAEEKQFRFDFAKLTRDFEQFSALAEEQAQFLMSKSAEELAYESAGVIENFKREAEERDMPESSSQYQYMLKNLADNAEKAVSYRLNELAWGYVLMAELPGDLERAMRWSDKSLAILETPTNLDTKAHLLYRMGKRKEAIKLEKKAIKVGKQLLTDTSAAQETLKRMRKKLPIGFIEKEETSSNG